MSNLKNFEPNIVLEEKIRLDLNNPSLYLDYANWLNENGQAEFATFITKCCEQKFRPEVLSWDPVKNGLDEMAFSMIGSRDYMTGKVRKWRYGFVQNHSIVSLYKLEELTDTLQLPFFNFLESINVAYQNLHELFEFFKNWEGLKYLKRLNIWDDGYMNGSGLGDLNLLLPQLEKIQYLYLVGNQCHDYIKDERTGEGNYVEIEIEKIYLPEVLHFGRISTNLSKSELDRITNAYWPKLEALTLCVGIDSELKAEDFSEFFKGENLKSLKDLAIRNCVDVDDVLVLLLNSPLLPQLKRVSFYNSDLTSKGAQILLENKSKFSHLEDINIRQTMLTEEDEANLVAEFSSIEKYNVFREEGEVPDEELIFGEHFWEALSGEDAEDMDAF
ncbi:MAG: hypothetical protein NVV82_26360 [Sporocytophaga sp.]|nr:hypothetical protein [Sporocytophaga sp.]